MGVKEYLAIRLEQSGKTQADVARETGLSTAVVSQIFSGKTKDPHLSKIVPIIKAIDGSMDELIEYAFVEFGDDEE